ncbi:hypothetical protein ACGFZG_08760 [Streptomyces antibioticus]|uniref:hypothetical protein n=1 Tax=Streptomyces antibioticus TaxID=1890 RepID=UPI00371D98B2
MSIRLIVEVLDHWKDFGLTVGERNDLIVIAENANDSTRETYGSIHEPYVLQRAGKSAAGWKNALGKLMGKKVLAYAVSNGREMRGHPGRHAVYRIPDLCPAPPHWGQQGMCSRPAGMGHLTDDPFRGEGGGMGHLTDDPKKRNGSPDGCEWVTQQVTPTPPYSSTTSPSSSAPQDGRTGEEGRQAAVTFLMDLPAPWGVGRASGERLAPELLAAAAATGWTLDKDLAAKLTENPDGIRNYPAVLAKRIADLPKRRPQEPARVSLPPACDTCLTGHPAAAHNARWRLRDGHPCPDCHPDHAKDPA